MKAALPQPGFHIPAKPWIEIQANCRFQAAEVFSRKRTANIQVSRYQWNTMHQTTDAANDDEFYLVSMEARQ